MKRILAVLMLVLASLTLSGAASAGECVPTDPYTETTEWVTEKPDGKGWYLVDERTVVDEEGYTIPGTPAQHYVHAHNEGDDPLGNDEVPPTPSEDPSVWQANTEQEPPGHYQTSTKPDGTPYVEGDSGLHFTSHGQEGEGRRDWFYFDPGTPDEVVEAVTHQEYKYARDFDGKDCPKPPGDDDKDPPKEPPAPPKYPPLAHTGFSAGWAASIALALAAIGGGALWYARKLKV